METESEETKHKGPVRRAVATKLWVYYSAPEAQECGLISFDFTTVSRIHLS